MSNSYTTDPLSVAVQTPSSAEFIRLPRPRERDPVFGLSRTTLNALILPTAENGHRPPVRSLVIRKRGARTGVRLVDLDSLRSYLHKQVEPSFTASIIASSDLSKDPDI
jgi:hypothetical protein